MAALKFSSIYDLLRAVTGNDDLDLGVEVLPDARLAVLVKTAVLTLPTYTSEFPALAFRDPGTGLEFYIALDDALELDDATVQAVLHVAAHKYYTGIGHKEGMEQSLAFILKCSENFAGQAVSAF